MDPGYDWRDTLIKKLKECQFFVLVLTENYHARYFTDQEFGMAVAMDKTIFVIRLDDTRPYGFMPHYQFVDERKARTDPSQSNMIRMVKAISGVVGVRLELKKYLQDLINSGS
ncbi:MAG: toll/interleukin-1 receptor domain-containing protein [Alphaproteobacteria bacterium]|nr:toll/interleukin-1 receptor domain-containing protein [Alphaproteobacteria bacterium]MDA8030121.1 toll/interleukin-1 receptor domain-containing protein [Alphaproteobacteria bacterium]